MMLFDPLTIRSLTLKNRIAVSPMCQYSAQDGFANDWHLVHLGSRAIGGAGLVMIEATAVTPEGRISVGDLGIWKDEHIEPLSRITRFLQSHGAIAGIQLAHAGRKASCQRPWEGGEPIPLSEAEGWMPVGPSSIAFSPASTPPHQLTIDEIHELTQAFTASAQRALDAGFQILELHGAHGYLFHEFLSPLSNQRTDMYGGSFDNRRRFLCETTQAVRAIWPDELPLFVRISATDWVEGGWDLAQSIELSKRLKDLGVDLIDCSSGGLVPDAVIPAGPNYQVPFAETIRKEANIPTGAVGIITQPQQANAIIEKGQADLILLGREMLREPYWPLKAAHELGVKVDWPVQYERAKFRK